MIIPKFEEIGKRSSEILSSLCDTGVLGLKWKTKQCGNELVCSGRVESDGKCRAWIGSRVDAAVDYGVQVQHKCNTDNVVFGEVAVVDAPVPGTRVGLTASVRPTTGQLGTALTVDLVRDSARVDVAVACVDHHQHQQPLCNAAAVFKWCECVVGYHCGGPAPSSAQQMTEWTRQGTVLFAYVTEQVEACVWRTVAAHTLVASIANKSVITAMQSAAKLTFDGQHTHLECGLVLPQFDKLHLLAKVNTEAVASIGWRATLSEAITARVWCHFDVKNKHASLLDRCKFGLALECEI